MSKYCGWHIPNHSPFDWRIPLKWMKMTKFVKQNLLSMRYALPEMVVFEWKHSNLPCLDKCFFFYKRQQSFSNQCIYYHIANNKCNKSQQKIKYTILLPFIYIKLGVKLLVNKISLRILSNSMVNIWISNIQILNHSRNIKIPL